MNEEDDFYISLGTGSAGYVSPIKSRKAKNPIGFALPKTKKTVEQRKGKRALGTTKRLPKRASRATPARARVTKSPDRRPSTTRKR